MPKSLNNKQVVQLEVSWSFLFKLLAVGLGFWALFVLRDIFFMLMVVFIFVAAVNPTIANMQKHMSRVLAVSFFFSVLLLALVLISYIFIPSFLHQFNELRSRLPEFLASGFGGLASHGLGNDIVKSVEESLRSVSGNLLATTVNVFGAVATAITGFVLSFYLLLEEKNARDFFHAVLPKSRFFAVYTTVSKISERMGSWVRAQLILMIIVGVANFVAFLILRVPTPVPLSIWSALTETIPYIGPILGVAPAALVSVSTGNFVQAILVVIINFIVIQQFESHFVVPRVMGKAVGLSPVLVILSILTGLKLFGFVGAVIAIPVAAVVSVIIGEWPELRKLWEAGGSDEEV